MEGTCHSALISYFRMLEFVVSLVFDAENSFVTQGKVIIHLSRVQGPIPISAWLWGLPLSTPRYNHFIQPKLDFCFLI